MTLAGRGDKPSSDDLAQALRTLQLILEDWATTKGVLLWNVLEEQIDVPRGDIVLHNGQYYQCYVDHISSADNEPGNLTSETWRNFWVAGKTVTDPLVWTLGNSYTNAKSFLYPNQFVSDILAVRIQYEGQISHVEKVGALDFANLDIQETGPMTHIYVQKTANGMFLNQWPLNNRAGSKLMFYSTTTPNEVLASDSTDMPSPWVTAAYYALATELGFLYNIPMDRLNVIGQKAEFEFNKALRINESEIDECFIKPLY